MLVPDETLQAIWERAMGEEIGIRIPTDRPEDLRKELYTYRKKAQNPELEKFAIFTPNLPDEAKEIWVIRKTTEVPRD